MEAIFLTDLERIEKIDPTDVNFVPDVSPHFKKSLLFVESKWRQKIPTDASIHLGHRAAMDTMEFQLVPAHLALSKPKRRILIADSVGLGKTLEAGILLSELIVRGQGKRILIVTVKSMMTQFQKEMWNRFTIPLVRLDSKKIQKLRSELPANYNPFFYYSKTIVSIDTIKRNGDYRTYLEDAWWDIIVIDEAQNVADRQNEAKRTRLAKLLSERSDTLIMLSATPHDGRGESFASLMNMLDPTAIANPSNYAKEDIKGLCVRRFKKDIINEIQGAFRPRKVTLENCQATEAEEEAFGLLASLQLNMDRGQGRLTGRLFKTVLEKSIFSSPVACVKTIDERLKKLSEISGTEYQNDIRQLTQLKESVERIDPKNFARYQKLLELLTRSDYGWTRRPDDRLVIFTERIETMNFLAKNLKLDLSLDDEAIIAIHGGLSDVNQQLIVENFGLSACPIKVLVATDVASEGLNLHYLCHRVIHFDIPWSLMVFQQRNGRVDRYGQDKSPDIRYLLTRSGNQKIKGDLRILEILATKEDQALKNIGDPAILMGAYTIEEEELKTVRAMEIGRPAKEFEADLDRAQFDPMETLLAATSKPETRPNIAKERTLFSDLDYVKQAIPFFDGDGQYETHDLKSAIGIEIKAPTTSDLMRRLNAVIPKEVFSGKKSLRLTPDKSFAMGEIKRSLQNSLSETAWPKTQYLWPLHPLVSWINDKCGLLYGRKEVPLIVLPKGLGPSESVFLIAGTIPNRKSAPVVDHWFGLSFKGQSFDKELGFMEALAKAGLTDGPLPNPILATDDINRELSKLRSTVIEEAKRVLNNDYNEYNKRMKPIIGSEIQKLEELEKRHLDYQESLGPSNKDIEKKAKGKDYIPKIFKQFINWVEDTLEIQDNPYLQIIAVLTGERK
jgi:ERCC4-related helicase